MIVFNIKPLLGITLYKKYNAYYHEYDMGYCMVNDFNYVKSYSPEYFIDLDTFRYNKLKELNEKS